MTEMTSVGTDREEELKTNCSNFKCEFDLDMDGQVTCVMCGKRAEPITSPAWGNVPPVEFEE